MLTFSLGKSGRCLCPETKTEPAKENINPESGDIMLLEIELGIKIEEKIEEYRILEDIGPDVEPSLNDDHIAAIEVSTIPSYGTTRTRFPVSKAQ
jgi:hypothetical protein